MTNTIEQYLQIIDNYTFSGETIQKALDSQSISAGSTAASVSQRSKDLAEAFMWDAACSLVNGGGGSVKYGVQSKTDASISASPETRLMWQSKAEALRQVWGETSSTDSENIYDATSLW